MEVDDDEILRRMAAEEAGEAAGAPVAAAQTEVEAGKVAELDETTASTYGRSNASKQTPGLCHMATLAHLAHDEARRRIAEAQAKV